MITADNFKNLVTLKDDGCEVALMFGRTCLGRAVEDEGRWYINDYKYKEIGNLMGYASKEIALFALLAWYTED